MNAGADPANPQSWNGYAYVINNPLAYTDPTRMFLSAEPYDDGGGDGGGGDFFFSGFFGGFFGGGAPLAPIVEGGGGAVSQPRFSVTHTEKLPTTTPAPTLPAPTPAPMPPAPPPQPNNVRPNWLNSITSIFGYARRIKLPSCASVALKTAADDLNPFLPAAADIAQGALNVGQAVKFNQALTYAAAKGLTYPNKSSVFRGILNTSKTLGNVANTLPLVNLDYALTDGLITEINAMNQGQCQ